MKSSFPKKSSFKSLSVFIVAITLTNCAAPKQSSFSFFKSGEILPIDKTSDLPQGSYIRLRLKSNDVKYGEYMGIKKLPFDNYQEKYDGFKKDLKLKVVLPAIRETVNLKLANNSEQFAEFLGFDFRTIDVRFLDEPETNTLPMGSLITMINQNGYTIEHNVLDVLSRTGDLPYRSVMIFREKNASMSTQIGVEKINHIQYISAEKEKSLIFSSKQA